MENFTDHGYVRLQNRVHGTYLHADEDGHGVSLHSNHTSMNAAWTVHTSQGYLLLHSAAYGRYLATTDAPAPLVHHGFRVEQRDYEYEQRQVKAIMWHAVWSVSDSHVLLCDVADRGLRANENGVSVDIINDIDNVGTMMHWAVHLIPSTEIMPRLPRPNPIMVARPFAGILAALAGQPSRRILYVREGADGTRITRSFNFRGRSVYHLRKKLARRLRAFMNVTNFAMCVEPGVFRRPTPLVVDLPCSTQDLHIVVFEAGTPAHAWVQYPDIF